MAGRGVNKVIIVGNLGQDPEIRFNPQGQAFGNFSVATSESWKDKQTGEPREVTEWHRCVVNGRLAEIVQQYVKKGSKVYLEGSLRTRKWQNQQGQDQYTTEIRVQNLQMLDSRAQGEAGGYQPQQAPYQAAAPAQQQGYAQAPQPAPQQAPQSAPQHAPQPAPQQAQPAAPQQAPQQAQPQYQQPQAAPVQPAPQQTSAPQYQTPDLDDNWDDDIPF